MSTLIQYVAAYVVGSWALFVFVGWRWERHVAAHQRMTRELRGVWRRLEREL